MTAASLPVDQAWLRLLAGDAPAELVARALRLAASGWAGAERVRRAVADLLEAGREPEVADVLAALERLVPPGQRLASPGEIAAAGAALAALGGRVLLPGFPGYPARLADAWPDLGAPAWLFVRGPHAAQAAPLPEGPAAAIVGTRHPSLDGLATARELGRRLARAGITVVSGLARGIDQAAHQGALDVNGPTVAVLGTGLDVDYPRGDGSLREEIAAGGGLVTEQSCGAPPRPSHFLARNRIIAGLADLTVVVEGRTRSGALQTARLAAAQGREVWAVPGSVNAPTSRGPLDLIRDGAQCVTRLDDVLEALGALGQRDVSARTDGAPPAGAPAPTALTPAARALLPLLGPVPAAPGALAASSGLALPALLAALSELTGCGLAARTARGFTAMGQGSTLG